MQESPPQITPPRLGASRECWELSSCSAKQELCAGFCCSLIQVPQVLSCSVTEAPRGANRPSGCSGRQPRHAPRLLNAAAVAADGAAAARLTRMLTRFSHVTETDLGISARPEARPRRPRPSPSPTRPQDGHGRAGGHRWPGPPPTPGVDNVIASRYKQVE